MAVAPPPPPPPPHPPLPGVGHIHLKSRDLVLVKIPTGFVLMENSLRVITITIHSPDQAAKPRVCHYR